MKKLFLLITIIIVSTTCFTGCPTDPVPNPVPNGPTLFIPVPDAQGLIGCTQKADQHKYVEPTTLLAWGGNPSSSYTWTKTSGSSFPAGTTVDRNGVFHSSGPDNPLVTGSTSFSMTVSDGSQTAVGVFTFVATATSDLCGAALFEQTGFDTVQLPDAKAGAGYGAQLFVSGGTPPYSWTMTSGNVQQEGLTIDQASGVIRGTVLSAPASTCPEFQPYAPECGWFGPGQRLRA